MLRKMLFQGLAAAVLIAGAGAVYAAIADETPVEIAQATADTAAPKANGDTGYLAQNPARAERKHADRDDRAHGERRERRAERHGEKHDSEKNR